MYRPAVDPLWSNFHEDLPLIWSLDYLVCSLISTLHREGRVVAPGVWSILLLGTAYW